MWLQDVHKYLFSSPATSFARSGLKYLFPSAVVLNTSFRPRWCEILISVRGGVKSVCTEVLGLIGLYKVYFITSSFD